jgi:hypothetical protein
MNVIYIDPVRYVMLLCTELYGAILIVAIGCIVVRVKMQI